jgi:hypothetical protein
MDFDGISGVESEFTYNGLKLNQRLASVTNFTRYQVTDIGGLDDADVRDARELNPARDGELALPAYYGGRTITFTGKILAKNVRELRQMQQNLRTAFASLNEQPLAFDNGYDFHTYRLDAPSDVFDFLDFTSGGLFYGSIYYIRPTNSPGLAVGDTINLHSIVTAYGVQLPDLQAVISSSNITAVGGGNNAYQFIFPITQLYTNGLGGNVLSGKVSTSVNALLYINARKSAPIQMRESQQGQYPTRDFLVTLRASDPRFYSSATNSVTRTGSQLATSFFLVNDGNAVNDPVIKITGPLVSTAGGATPQFAIANTSLGQAIGFRFPAAGMATSTSIATINCKTRTISGSLAYSDLLSNSVFPGVAGGTNTFAVSGLTGTGNVQVIYKNSWI